MTPIVHLLLLGSLLCIAAGKDLEEKKGPFVDVQLDVTEATPVPYPVYQFLVPEGANSFKLNGEGTDIFRMSKDGWLYLEKPLDWSQATHYAFNVEAVADEDLVDGPILVSINVLDVNNNAPRFNQSIYTATILENRSPVFPFIRVFASDRDDPETPNAQLRYSLVSQIPSHKNTFLFQIDPDTGDISTTPEGEEMLKASEGIQYARGEDQSIDSLKAKFNDYCTVQDIPYEENPFFTCVERQEIKRRNLDPLEDPDYTLFIRVEDMGGATETALSGTARVHIAVLPNLWRNPGQITIAENLKVDYPHVIAKVQSNDPNAIYTLVQKERELRFPFQITENGEILVTEELDREDKEMYILVVFAKDNSDKTVDPPMEIPVLVLDKNDNQPMCSEGDTLLEVQENEPIGSFIGRVSARDDDKEGTLNSKLTYTLRTEDPSILSTFSIDENSGDIQALRLLQRREGKVYNLEVSVSDADFTTNCKVTINVIDVNNELPLFEKTHYGNHSLTEDAEVGKTVMTIRATDADEPDSGSSYILFNISKGNDGDVFDVQTDGQGVGYVVIAKPLDFESLHTYNLQIDARNKEPLMEGLHYGSDSTATLTLSITDVDEAPEFSLDVLDVAVPENFTKGSVLYAVKAKDPEGKEIGFKLDGDAQGWLEIDAASGEIRTKEKLDREKVETFDLTVTAFEKDNPEKSSETVVHVRLLDVNDNVPKLTETKTFLCMQNIKPVIITAEDGDSDPFSRPFNFSFTKKSANWKLRQIDESSAELQLVKKPLREGTYSLKITVKDKAGMGVPQLFEVKICNCTSMGYCYVAPHGLDFKPQMGLTVGIFIGILGFSIILFIIAVKRSAKKTKNQAEDGEQKPMM
ncbi:PREDICTED: cadherin-17 [Cyprinodon variegatus]|uniref:Cadherin 17, LI cadherin (liver-intestine) n=1 Tax=Cyprinodon variegatus TaxID=28743 RepID=A0A3Q2CQ14_CYPVA|nr:PREDICTED: cadherin-17 [Cyprinodon variegatus]